MEVQHKSVHQQMVSDAIDAFRLAASMRETLKQYIESLGASNLAITKAQAQNIIALEVFASVDTQPIVAKLQERIRISIDQGQKSLDRKAELRAAREAAKAVEEAKCAACGRPLVERGIIHAH